MLCEKCLTALNATVVSTRKQTLPQPPNKKYKLDEEIVHHEKWDVFLKSAMQGCAICARVFSYSGMKSMDLSQLDVDTSQPFSRIKPSFDKYAPNPRATVLIQMVDMYASDVAQGVEFMPYQEQPRQKALRAARDPTAARMELLKMWFDDCSNGHDCTSAIVGEYAPTRVVELLQDSKKPQWRVLDAEIPSSKAQRYATVSHRRIQDTIKLTTENYAQMKELHPDSELPANIRRVFEVARYLGIKSVWLDSLCVIQNSDQDLHQEAMKMNKIYRHSCCNFVVGSALETANSSLWCGSESLREPDVVQLHWEANRWKPFSKGVKAGKTEYHVSWPNIWTQYVEESPLSERAWIWQELLLCPVTVHLHGDQLLWDCAQLKACECFPEGVPFEWVGTQYTTHPTKTDQVKRANPAQVPGDEELDAYYRKVVAVYSAKYLSRPEDKLIAFAGFAKAINAWRSDEYHAGFFKRDLPMDLLWFRQGPEPDKMHLANPGLRTLFTLTRPEKYKAPSWSWASVDGPVEFYEPQYGTLTTPLVTLKDVTTMPAKGDEFGLLENGRIELSGRLMVIDYGSIKPPGFEPYADLPQLVVSDGRAVNEGISSRFDIDEDNDGMAKLFLPVRLFEQTIFRRIRIVGLILSPLPGGKPFDFVRKGTLENKTGVGKWTYREGLDAMGLKHLESGHDWTGYNQVPFDITLF